VICTVVSPQLGVIDSTAIINPGGSPLTPRQDHAVDPARLSACSSASGKSSAVIWRRGRLLNLLQMATGIAGFIGMLLGRTLPHSGEPQQQGQTAVAQESRVHVVLRCVLLLLCGF
jgi:hypothetical protein